MTRPRKIALLGLLYVAQGLPFGFQSNALPIYLREVGVSLTGVALAGALSLPWLLKALWAPLIDTMSLPRLGRRKSWIVPSQLGLLLCTVCAALLPKGESLSLLAGVILAMNFFAATQDIAVDGLAVDLLGPDELGFGNAAQVIGFKVGMVTSGGLLVWASGLLGWSGLFGSMALILLLVLFVSLRFDEPAPRRRDEGEPTSVRDVVVAVIDALRAPGAGWVLAFIATYKFGETMADTMFKPLLVDAGFTAPTIGKLVGTYGMGFSVLGSLLGGLLATRITLWKAVGISAALRVLPIVGEWWVSLHAPSEVDVLWVTSFEHLFGGMLTPCMFAFMMSRIDRRYGATQFTVLATVELLGKAPAGWVSGLLADRLGYPPVFALSVGLSVAFLSLLWPISRLPEREHERSATSS